MAFQLQQKDFDIATALGGNDITLGNNIVTNFRQDTALTIDRAYPYIGVVDGVTYHFNTRGECKENPSLSLQLSSIDINHIDTGGLNTSEITEQRPCHLRQRPGQNLRSQPAGHRAGHRPASGSRHSHHSHQPGLPIGAKHRPGDSRL